MTMTTDRVLTPVPVCAECTNHFNPFIDGNLGVVFLTQEHLEELLKTAFYGGFEEGLAQGLFGDSMFSRVLEEESDDSLLLLHFDQSEMPKA